MQNIIPIRIAVGLLSCCSTCLSPKFVLTFTLSQTSNKHNSQESFYILSVDEAIGTIELGHDLHVFLKDNDYEILMITTISLKL